MDKVRIATIGRSAITERFLDALGQVPEAEYVAAYSRKEEDARAFAEAHGAQLAFSSLEELAASDKVDAIYIGSPKRSSDLPMSRALSPSRQHGTRSALVQPT